MSSQRIPAGAGGWDDRMDEGDGRLEEICLICWRWGTEVGVGLQQLIPYRDGIKT